MQEMGEESGEGEEVDKGGFGGGKLDWTSSDDRRV